MTPILGKVFFALALLVGAVFGALAQIPAGTNLPSASLQILSGAHPHAVSLSFDGKELYPGLKAGARISNFGVTNRSLLLKIQKTETSDAKEFPLSFVFGKAYTLCVLGDFAPLPAKEGRDGKKKTDFRIEALLMENEKPAGSTVKVRAINGLTNRAIELKREGSVVCRAEPGQAGSSGSLPPDLYLQASDGKTTESLYLAQSPPAANITIVFYERDGRMAFKAMTERTEAP